MIKPLKVSDKSVRRFKTHKLWSYDNITSVDDILLEQENLDGPLSLFLDESTVLSPEQTSSSTKLKVTRGKRYEPTDTFYPVGHSLHDPTKELINGDGSYQRVVYNSIKHLFYNEYGVSTSLSSTGTNVKNPLMVFGSETGNYMMNTRAENTIFSTNNNVDYERRSLQDDIIVVQFDSSQMGEKIKPGDFRIRDYSSPYGVLEVVDDGATNLVISTSSFNEIKEVSGSSLTDVKSINSDSPIFNFNDLTFGYKISSAGKYFISGQPVMSDAPTEVNSGRAVLYKLNEETQEFQILREFFNPFTQNGLSTEIQNDNTGFLMTELEGMLINEDYSINDNFGDAVELKHNCCVVGSSQSHIRGVCSELGKTGHIFVYDRDKGGADHWGLVNIIEGEPGTEFGASVSIKGKHMVVGAPGYNNSEGAIYLFEKSVRTESHPWKRISNSFDDYDWDEEQGVYVGKPTGEKLERNNKSVSRYNIKSLVPNADKLTHFYIDSSKFLTNLCTEANLNQYTISVGSSTNDQTNGISASGWKMSGILSASGSDSSESSLPYPVDVYDSSDNLIGNIIYTGKPKVMSLYFSFGEDNLNCISGTIQGNSCRMTGGLLQEQCSEPGFTEYRVSLSESVSDQLNGVTSSTWMKPGILSVSGSDTSTSSEPYAVDVYDSSNSLIGHITYTGKPKSMNLYFRTSDMDASCVYGKIEGNICILPTELVISGTTSGICTEDGYTEYEVSPQEGITDQEAGIISSTWTRLGILSLPSTKDTSQPTPNPVDVLYQDELLGHITFTGTPASDRIYFTEGAICLSGKIIKGECILSEHQPLIGKKISGDLIDYSVSTELGVNDNINGIISSEWLYSGILSLPYADSTNSSTPYFIDVYDIDGLFVGHITYTGLPVSSNIYFTDQEGFVFVGTIVGGKCEFKYLNEPPEQPTLEQLECTEDGFNTYNVSSEQIVDDSEWGVKTSTWAYTGTLSISHADTKYGTQSYTVDVIDQRNIMLGTLTYYGNPSSMNIYFKRDNSLGCESGVIVDNVCKLTPYDIIDKTEFKETPCDSIDAIEIETFDGEYIATEGTVTGFPPHQYEEDDNGNTSPEHSIGNITWDLVEVITVPGSRRLGEQLKLTGDLIYSTSPSSRIKYCNVLKKLPKTTECGVGWKHTHNITKNGIYNFDTDPIGLGDGFERVSADVNDNEVVIKTIFLNSDPKYTSGFVYRVDAPLNESFSSFNNELIVSGGTYVEGSMITLTLSNGMHDVYLGRIDKSGQLVGRQSRINLAINPIPYNLTSRKDLVKFPYDYDFNVDGSFGISLDANEKFLLIGDAYDRKFNDPNNPNAEFVAGAVYAFSVDGGKISFLEKLYADELEEFTYSSEYGRSVSIQGTDFLVGAPSKDASEISVLDGGENIGVKDFRRGTRRISDRTYVSEQLIYTNAECSYVGGDMPDVVVKIPIDTLEVNESLISEFMITADFIKTDKNSLYTLRIPTDYTKHIVSPDKSVTDNVSKITSSTWMTTGVLWLPPAVTNETATPTPIDVYDSQKNFLGHITYTGQLSVNKIYFVENGTPYVGEIENSRCMLTDYTENLGSVTRGVYRDLTKIEDGKVWFYVDVDPDTFTQTDRTWSQDGVEFVYYVDRNAEEGSVFYYRIGESSIDRKAFVKTNKYPYKVRHQFGTAVSLSSDYIYVGSPVMGDFPANELEAFEGSDLGLFEQCSKIYSSYGDIAWGRLSNMDKDVSGKILAYDVASLRDDERVYVGNVFYKNGIAVITNSSDYFKNMFSGSNDTGFEVSYRGTHAIYENEILCSVAPSEFNVSTNPTSVSYDDIDYDVNGDTQFDIKDLAYIYRYMIGSLVDIQIDIEESYTVQKETLETICREFSIPYPSSIDIEKRFKIPVEVSFGMLDIRRVNNGVVGNKLRYDDAITVGESLVLPSGYTHTVRPVQSIESIAKFTGVTVDAIYQANPTASASPLYLGQTLIIPAGGDFTPGIKFEEGNNSNWPNDDLALTETEDLILMDVLLRSTENSVGENEYNKILTKLESLEERGLLDIDGDGMVTDVDAKLLVRYFVGRTGTDLTDGLINTFTNGEIAQSRNVAYQILEFLDERTGKNRGVEILQDFVDYRENDAKDQLGSYLAPFATTIGIYSGLELVMVAKLSRPVKIVPNYPINFLVKYDT